MLPRFGKRLEVIKANLKSISVEMEDYQSDRSEKWEESEAAETFQANIDAVDEAIDSLENLE